MAEPNERLLVGLFLLHSMWQYRYPMPASCVQEGIALFRSGDLSAAEALADTNLQIANVESNEYWQLLFVKSECLRMRGRTREALGLIGNEINENVSPEVLALWKMHRGYVLGMRNSYLDARQDVRRGGANRS